MHSFIRLAFATVGFASLVLAGPVSGAPLEKTLSTPPPVDEGLRRCGYHPAGGKQLIGEAVISPSGEELAFFEQNGGGFELVVCIKGGDPARWAVSEQMSRLKIFWVGRSELVLGQNMLAPRARVRWQVARS